MGNIVDKFIEGGNDQLSCATVVQTSVMTTGCGYAGLQRDEERL